MEYADKKTVNFSKTNMEYQQQQPQPAINEPFNESRIGWFKDSQRNKPQSKSLIPALCIFGAGGMGLALSIGLGTYSFKLGTHTQFCWFIAVIVGSCISTVLVHKIQKRVFYYVASVLVIINGVLDIALTHTPTSLSFVRYCNGIAFGLTLIPTILAGSEQSAKRFRGNVLTVEQTGLAFGLTVMLSVLLIFGVIESTTKQYILGILILFYGIAALISTFFLTLESPVFLLNEGNENEAVNVLRKLQNPERSTYETNALLVEYKALLQEDFIRGRSQNISNSWMPMIKMILFRCFVSMSLSFPLNKTILMASIISSGSAYTMVAYAIIYAAMRMLGITFAMVLVDIAGRRIPSAFALLLSGVILFAVGLLSSNAAIIILMFIYQLLSGFVAPISTCYLGEAFSVSVKPYFILAAVASENILQILVSCLLTNDIESIALFVCVLGVLQGLYAIVFYFIMPETKQTTLREALTLFQTVLVSKRNPESGTVA